MKNYTVRILQADEVQVFEQLVHLMANVFELGEKVTLPNAPHLKHVLAQTHFKVLVVYAEQEMVGGLTGFVLQQYYDEKPQFYLYDLAVLPEWQRKGVGKTLLQYLIDWCTKAGLQWMFVQADAEDKHAIDFYRATGGQSTPVWHFSYILDFETKIRE